MGFDKIEYDKWIEKVKKELKLDSLDAKHVQLSEDLNINPFFERNQPEIHGTRKENTWENLFIISADKTDNAMLLNELQGGINKIRLNQSESIEDYDSLFESIELSYIHTIFSFSANVCSLDVISLIDFLDTREAMKHVSVIANSLDEDMKATLSKSGILLMYEYKLDGHEVDTEMEEIALSIIEKHEEGLFHNANILITREISSSIIEELGIKHAIDLLMQNINNGFENKLPKIQRQAICKRSDKEELERQYIILASKGLTAAIASYDSIFIEAASDQEVNFHRRISRNIHHLLQMESFLQNSSEAYKGSYQIENIGIKIAESVFEKLN